MTDKEKGYIAGMIDADGCIGTQKSSNCRTYRPYVVIVQKNPTVLLWFKNRFGGSIMAVHRNHKSGRKRYFRWMVVNKKAADMLKLCLDCLIEKKAQAVLAIQMVEVTGCGKYRGVKLPDFIIEKQKELYEKVKLLNSPATTECDNLSVEEILKMRQSELTGLETVREESEESLPPLV